jgi:hypothetical protein
MTLLLAVCLALGSARQASPALATPPHESAGRLTSIVVADIDADGDADVVATDDALNLFVWINDGTGRLTRQRPAPPRDDRTGAPNPGVDDTPTAPDLTAPTDPPTVDMQAASCMAATFAWSGVTRVSTPDRRERPHLTQALRGPPSDSPAL